MQRPRDESHETEAGATATARNYYNSTSADSFYHTIWGGEDIHIGLYASPSDTIAHASQKTVERMAELLAPITPATRILDLGAGYGGAARWLARTYGCNVTCLNLSEVQNERNREKTRDEGLEALIEVIDGAFEKLPFGDGAFEVVWSQDSFLHSSDREAVLAEIARVLVARGGRVVFTDPMAAEEADPERLVPIQKRLDIEGGLATRRFYRDRFLEGGFEDAGFEERIEQLVTHYSRVLAALEDAAYANETISDEFVKNAKTGLLHWINGGREKQLDWGIFHFFR